MKLQQIKEMVKNRILAEQTSIDEHNEIKDLLSKVEGKQFNHKTFSKKILGEKFTFESKYGMFYIVGKLDHLIGHFGDNGVSVEKFERFDICYGSAAVERIKKLENLNLKTTLSLFSSIEKHFEELQYLFGEANITDNPLYYDLLRSISDSKNEEHLRLSNFYFIRKKRGTKC